ncbi:MAG: hypothetical protein JWN80_3132 [Microbacteriaceae bacterium]|jgi:hypothetical protein|nr:hypothetical protein [Microbacteriaceae bacterium]
MSKKIDDARKKFSKALKKHAEAVGGSRVPLKQAERAASKLQDAATAYAAAVKAKSGLDTPFSEVKSTGLDDATITSLAAERDALSKSLTGPVPVQKAAKK